MRRRSGTPPPRLALLLVDEVGARKRQRQDEVPCGLRLVSDPLAENLIEDLISKLAENGIRFCFLVADQMHDATELLIFGNQIHR